MNRIMRKIVLWICLLVTSVLYAQETSLSVKLSQGHPRYLTDSNGKVETQKLIKEEPIKEMTAMEITSPIPRRELA